MMLPLLIMSVNWDYSGCSSQFLNWSNTLHRIKNSAHYLCMVIFTNERFPPFLGSGLHVTLWIVLKTCCSFSLLDCLGVWCANKRRTCCMIMSLPRHFKWKRFHTVIEDLLNFDFKVGALMQAGYPGGTRLSKPIQPKELYKKKGVGLTSLLVSFVKISLLWAVKHSVFPLAGIVFKIPKL